MDALDVSRWQFGITTIYHFLFVPLTLGLSFMLVIMESIYVMTRRPIWRTITKFWGTLFGINFVLGVATGLTMEFQFGMNWSYYSHYVGDIFGAPLAIEGLMAFFLEATFVGLMFFGWDKLKPHAHLFVTFLVALGTNLSALWILIANGWMQNPVGAEFNPITMRMELTSFFEVMFNSVAQAKFVHTVSAGYVTAAIFVLGVSSWYMLRGRHLALARRSIAVAASFGLASALSVVVLGDESGYALTDNQKMKLAAIEAAKALLRATGHDSADGPWIPLGVGVHCGNASVRTVGSHDAETDITVLGDAPNAAAKLLSAAAAGEIMLSDGAYDIAGLTDDLERRTLKLKVKSEPMGVCVLTDISK